MANLDVVTVNWTGFPGGPGTSTFYMVPGEHDLEDLKDFYGLCAGLIPSSVTIQVQNSGGTIDAATGDLVDAWAAAPVASVPGGSGAEYAAGVGAVVRWDTGTVLHGRNIRGHTYLIPLIASCYDTNGSMDASSSAIIQGAADSTVTAYTASLAVWHRPRPASEHFGAARAGSHVIVTGATLIDRVSILRSRRN